MSGPSTLLPTYLRSAACLRMGAPQRDAYPPRRRHALALAPLRPAAGTYSAALQQQLPPHAAGGPVHFIAACHCSPASTQLKVMGLIAGTMCATVHQNSLLLLLLLLLPLLPPESTSAPGLVQHTVHLA